MDLEIPLGKRTKLYRFFEMVPAILSYGAFIVLIVLSLTNTLLAAIYLIIIITTVLARAIMVAIHTFMGHHRLIEAQKVDWSERLADLEDPESSYANHKGRVSKAFGYKMHVDNLRLASVGGSFPKPSELYNIVIIAAYNEGYDVIQPTIQSLVDTNYDKKRLVIAMAYEERGGPEIKRTVEKLKQEFEHEFMDFVLIQHPRNLPNEVVGKGGNITYAGKYMQKWCDDKEIAYSSVIMTTLDSDNRPHRSYFDYVTYEYIVHEDRKHLAYQPIALFLNNIWDVPAPMRVVATGNTFWNIISSMRPHQLRNFASHSQPMEALVEMNFWSTRSIVEDGHQFWRSFFHFSGNYRVSPVYIPIYQDAVLDVTYTKTLRAQFIQLRRWMYGASDVAYVASHIFSRKRAAPLGLTLLWFFRALDGYVTAASLSIIVAIGGWVPILINSQAGRDVVAHQLPDVISIVQTVALIGLILTVFLSMRMLPPRPERYKRHRTIWMVLQWVMMPLTAIVYLSFAALNAQARLFFGRYLTKFDVTAKATQQSKQLHKEAKLTKKASKSNK